MSSQDSFNTMKFRNLNSSNVAKISDGKVSVFILCRNLVISCVSLLVISPAQADQIKYLAHGENALAARILQVRMAQRSIDIATYDFSPCTIGMRQFTQELLSKADSGVRVRFIVDARNVSENIRANLSGMFQRHRVEFKLYNRGILAAENLRTHVKLQVVDDKSYIVGGRNLEASYFGFDPETNYIDREALVRGDSAHAAGRYFRELWVSPKAVLTTAAKDTSAFEKTCLGYTEDDKKLYADIEINGAESLRQIPTRACENVTFHGDNPEFLNNVYQDQPAPNVAVGTVTDEHGSDPLSLGRRLFEKRSTLMYLDFIYRTQRSLLVENWGYMPEHRLRSEIDHLRDRNVPIMVVTNFPDGADKGEMGPFTAVLDRHERRDNRGSQRVLPVCDKGSVQDENSLKLKRTRWVIHSKVAVRDSKDVVIGSWNFDERSYDTNLEAVIRVNDCPLFASDVQIETTKLVRFFNQDLENKKCMRTGDAPFIVRAMGWLESPFY